jgi:hypothetical protein
VVLLEDGKILLNGLLADKESLKCAFLAASNGFEGALESLYGTSLFLSSTWHYQMFCYVSFDSHHQTGYDMQDILFHSLTFVQLLYIFSSQL